MTGLPCTVSVPNLKTDRLNGLAGIGVALNVRRLIYQTLIWAKLSRHQTRGLRPALNPEDLEREADALVDGVRGNTELDRNFLGREMLVDQAEAIELARGKSRHRTRARS